MSERIQPTDSNIPTRELTPQEVLQDAHARFKNLAISFSGAEDVVLIDMAQQLGLNIDVFSLDTGRLHPETYQFIEVVRNRYGVAIEMLMPQANAVQKLVKEKGLYSFYQDDHGECCGVRKINPLRQKLAGVQAWVTGQRQDQSVTRANVPLEQPDTAFSTADNDLVKFNPLSNWSSSQVWTYIRENSVPYNSLHDRGFVSIGCEPCTRAVGPNEHERAGRWWWESATQKECGLHGQNVVKLGAT